MGSWQGGGLTDFDTLRGAARERLLLFSFSKFNMFEQRVGEGKQRRRGEGRGG